MRVKVSRKLLTPLHDLIQPLLAFKRQLASLLWLSEITICLGRGGWQQNHSAMSSVAELVMPPEYFWWLSLFSVVLAAASTQHRVPTAADRSLSPFLRFCFRSRWCIGGVVRTSELQLSRLWVDFLDADATTEQKFTEAQSFSHL